MLWTASALHRKHIFRNTISFHQSQAIFFRILFHIIKFRKHFAMNFKFFPMNDMGCHDIIAMLCVTMINIKMWQFELSFPASSDLFKVNYRNSRKKLRNMFKVNDKDTRTMSMTSFWCFYCWIRTYFTPSSGAYCWLWTIISWLKLNY